MGDRRMAEVKTEDGSLYIYSHWGGHKMPEVAMEAIATARPRWSDEPYAIHIILDQMTKADRDSETGTGIMLAPYAEDEYNSNAPSVIINLINRTITVIEDGGDRRQVMDFENVAKWATTV